MSFLAGNDDMAKQKEPGRIKQATDLKEKKVAVFAVIILILSIIALVNVFGFGAGFGEWVSGFASSTIGTATVNVTLSLSLYLEDSNITFGNGAVTGIPYAIVDSTGASCTNCSGWGSTNDPFVIQNDGNVYANVTITASVSAGAWFGGNAANAAMWYNYTNYESNSCLLDSGNPYVNATNSTWRILPVTSNINYTCQKLNYSEEADEMRIDLKLQVPADAPIGLKTNAITFTASYSA